MTAARLPHPAVVAFAFALGALATWRVADPVDPPAWSPDPPARATGTPPRAHPAPEPPPGPREADELELQLEAVTADRDALLPVALGDDPVAAAAAWSEIGDGYAALAEAIAARPTPPDLDPVAAVRFRAGLDARAAGQLAQAEKAWARAEQVSATE